MPGDEGSARRNRDLKRQVEAALSWILDPSHEWSIVGIEQLREQIEGIEVTGGPVTALRLRTRPSAPRADIRDGYVPLRSTVRSVNSQSIGELTMRVKGGYLVGLDYGWHTDDPPTALPKPEDIDFDVQ